MVLCISSWPTEGVEYETRRLCWALAASVIKHKQGTPDYFHRTWEQRGNQSRGGCQNVAHQSCEVQWHRSDTERVCNMKSFEPKLTWRVSLKNSLAELLWHDEMDIWTADVWRDVKACWWHLSCLLRIKAKQREAHGMNRNDRLGPTCRFSCLPPGVWYKCKISGLNCSHSAPLAIMTLCTHKNSEWALKVLITADNSHIVHNWRTFVPGYSKLEPLESFCHEHVKQNQNIVRKVLDNQSDHSVLFCSATWHLFHNPPLHDFFSQLPRCWCGWLLAEQQC